LVLLEQFIGLGLHPLRLAPGRASGPLPLSPFGTRVKSNHITLIIILGDGETPYPSQVLLKIKLRYQSWWARGDSSPGPPPREDTITFANY